MDPLGSVFSITGSDSGSMNGDTLVHPGDSASPLEIIEWLDRVDEKLDATSYGSVRRGDIPAKLLRRTLATHAEPPPRAAARADSAPTVAGVCTAPADTDTSRFAATWQLKRLPTARRGGC